MEKEMKTCKCCGSVIPEVGFKTWDEIPSSYNWARRAVEVALVQKSPIVFYGNSWAAIMAEATKALDGELLVYHAKPCPCGGYRSPIIPCTCSVGKIQSWENKNDFQRVVNSYHIWIEVNDSDARLDTMPNRFEKIAVIVQRSTAARGKTAKISDQIEPYGETLIQAWDRQTHATHRLPVIKSVALSIASIAALYADVVSLSAAQIAEAMQYQRKNW